MLKCFLGEVDICAKGVKLERKGKYQNGFQVKWGICVKFWKEKTNIKWFLGEVDICVKFWKEKTNIKKVFR